MKRIATAALFFFLIVEAGYSESPATVRAREIIEGIDALELGGSAELRQALYDELVQLGTEAVPVIVEVLSTEGAYPRARGPLISALGAIGDPAGVPAILPILSIKSSIVPSTEIFALSQIGSEEAIEGLMNALFEAPKDGLLFYEIWKDLMEHCTNPAAIPALSRVLETHYMSTDDSAKSSPAMTCDLAIHLLVKLEAKETAPLLERVARESNNRDIVRPAIAALIVLDLNAAERALLHVKDTTQNRYVLEKTEADLISVRERIEAAKAAQ